MRYGKLQERKQPRANLGRHVREFSHWVLCFQHARFPNSFPTCWGFQRCVLANHRLALSSLADFSTWIGIRRHGYTEKVVVFCINLQGENKFISQCMILIDFVILQREMALASWFPGFWVCGFLGVLNHVLNTLSVFFSIYVFLLFFFRAWNQMPQQIAKPWYQPQNPKTQWINQTYPQKLQINHWINFTKINPKTTPILNEPWTKPEESQTNPE